MAKFRIVSNNLYGLAMQKRTAGPEQSLNPVVMGISNVKDLDDGFYEMDINVTVSKYIDEGEATLNLELKYAPVVYVGEEEDLNTVLIDFAPHRLYENVRALVWNLSSEANMPLMLDDDVWIYQKAGDNQEGVIQRNEQDDVVSDKQEDVFGDIVKTFKDIPSYDYYYRFITPITYAHPDFEECDKETWDVLYRLLFGSLTMDCHLEERFDGSLDLRFCDVNGCGDTVSNLTLYELNLLLLRLWVELGNNELQIMKSENLNQEVECEFDENDLISKEDFFALYKIDKSNPDDNLLVTLGKMYDKIVKCDAESFPYRC
ncbi:MAG: protein-export chaperone SecB [Bacteroidales bacterium]|nr:protein-export chaperone SecB [Bacteroidales bacterium]